MRVDIDVPGKGAFKYRWEINVQLLHLAKAYALVKRKILVSGGMLHPYAQ